MKLNPKRKVQGARSVCSGLFLAGATGTLLAMTALGGCGGQPSKNLSAAPRGAEQHGVDLVALSHVAVPQPIGGDVIDHAAAVRLGKALFWEQQLGSDGKQSCATCHFQGGADGRMFNVVNPGPSGMFQVAGINGPGQWLSPAIITSDSRIGSQGLPKGTFVSVASDPLQAADNCSWSQMEAPFWAYRSVTGRNTPSAVAAVFNRQNFWDGRANHVFNGLNPFGSTGNAGLANQGGSSIALDSRGGGGGGGHGGGGGNVENGSSASAAIAMLDGSSASSQAVGPPLSGVEMSCAGRTFNGPNSLGAKVLARQPLRLQSVAVDDSALGMLSASPKTGLKVTYRQLISAAFGQAMAANAEAQFSRIFGQAIQAYESTLIPDKTPFDRFLDGHTSAMTASQKRGLDVFTGKASCTKCHAGGELTDASVSFAAKRGLLNDDGGDQGFHNTGVRPTAEDAGRAGMGPMSVAWSQSGSPMDKGAFKTPGLRNLKLTAPFMHNGGLPTIASVVDFYDRGGDFANAELASRMKPLGLSADEKSSLVDFLENALTDCRVEMHAAPFDHPSLEATDGPSLPAAGKWGYGPCH